jgi:hypothetical protein
MTKDYYRILGVLDDAEDIVIKAAYKALAQRYHPDKWGGDKDEATRRMSDINEAYAVLSDPVKRKEYDSTRDKNSYQTEPEDDELSSSVESDWKKVIKFYPDLEEIAQQLAKISKSLESSYKITLLEEKEFTRRKELAEIFENHFLEKYFGTNKTIIDYVKTLIRLGEKKAVKTVNEAVNLLGSNVDPDVIIREVDREYKFGKYMLAKVVLETSSFFKSVDLIQIMIGSVEGPRVKDKRYIIESGSSTQYMTKDEVIEYARILAIKLLGDRDQAQN